MLDEDQQTAFDLAKDGHNLVVIGQGGCGKTFLHDHPQAHLLLEAAVKNHRLKLLANFQIKLTNS
jgi:predicted ATPase with chaperone activity